MRVDVNVTGLEGVLATLQALPKEVVQKRGGPVRAAVRKSANLIRNEARAQMLARGQSPGKTGENYATGFTAQHIIIKRRKLRSINGEWFVVTVRSVPHPGGNKIGKGKRPIKTNDVAFIMEYGSVKQPAEPWLRPAFESRAAQAIQMMSDELNKGIARIVKKLAAQNKGK